MVLKVNTIDSRKIIGEVIKSPFFELELHGILALCVKDNKASP